MLYAFLTTIRYIFALSSCKKENKKLKFLLNVSMMK